MHDQSEKTTTFKAAALQEIIDFWQSKKTPHQMALLTAYDVKELKENNINLSDTFYMQFSDFCKKTLKENPEYSEHQVLQVCDSLPTTLLMYFMQNLHRVDKTRFSSLYRMMVSDKRYEHLISRCMSFEKNIILTRVFNEDRIKALQQALMHCMEQ
ncbi:type IVB secretion system protein IcmW [Facilibium subflavum]|uniref:type IVB secretion system protein IcmW n=1 Tax=Facilibium subflavum TaxID=2219058 RepID=UPI000E650BFC|nr:hypothetical protein [Facilibium subflavum]